jgi:hypothetical protein
VGSCVGVAPYYEKFGAYSPSVAHAFVAADEPPCAHDPGSAVATCKWHCGEIFGRRGYDTLQGRFVEMPPTDPRSLAAATLIDHPRFGDLTPLEACLDNCGPPNRMMPAPPFILDDAEMEDHWFFVTYHRWNPNQDLARWLRSYTVNPDKRTAPARVCQKLFDSYCENLLPEGIDRSRCSEEGAGSTGRGDAGQCEIFRHGKTLCPGICYRRGGDSIRVPEHICDRDDDLRCDAVEAVCLDR